MSSTSDVLDGTPGVWYRHSGEEEVDKLPYFFSPQYKHQTVAEIKEEVGDHHITHMWIKGELPTLDDIGSHITHLGLYEMSIPKQLKGLSKLPNLSVLELEDCVLSSERVEAIAYLTSLKVFKLGRCNLREIIDEESTILLDLSRSEFRQCISASRNDEVKARLMTLMGLMPAITIGAIKLPENYRPTKLPNLPVLKFSCCHFPPVFPKWIIQLTSLKELSLQYCLDTDGLPLTELPEGLISLHQLEKLDLRWSNFSQGIPPVVGEMSSLKDLNVSRCELTDLPAELSSLRQLEKLDLSCNNSFGRISPEISEMSSLKDSNMSSPKLTDVPAELGLIHKMPKLDPPYRIPSTMVKISSLKELDISSCNLTFLPVELSSLHQLEKLNLSYNDNPEEILYEIGEVSSLKELDMSWCELTRLPPGLSSFHQLEKLDLSDNNFSGRIPPEIGEMSSLEELDMSSCELTDLPAEFVKLKKLWYLSLRSNNFTKLPPAIYKLPNLDVLYMGENKQLKCIEKGILQLKLYYIDCKNCVSLESPPYDVCKRGLTAMKKYFKD